MPTPKNEPTQIDKFKEAQRELETDQSQEHFDAILKKVAKSPSPAGKPKGPRDA
jgi:hypothetical protein